MSIRTGCFNDVNTCRLGFSLFNKKKKAKTLDIRTNQNKEIIGDHFLNLLQ
jgi:hypothetical protein